MKEEIVKDVVEQIINMLTNNVLADYGSESFENWCEDGVVFENNGHTDAALEERKQVMKRLAPFVDELSNEIERVLDGD